MLGKKDSSFPLDGAKWPVLVVDVTGKVRRCNQAARQQLSPDGKEIAHLDAVWTPENGCSAPDFVKRVAAASIPTFPLRLKTKVDGELKPFTAHICHVQQGEQKLTLLQFHGRKAAMGSPAPAANSAVEPPVTTGALADAGSSGELEVPHDPMLSASDQRKLMCALQLTRTVAMDFNNALTAFWGTRTC